jgi:glycosyltransferase involved in cell wall biosynthesis
MPADKVVAIGNGIDIETIGPQAAFQRLDARPGAPLIVFTGQMDYRPNIEAVSGFASEVLPKLRVKHPEICFAIVGRNPDRAVLKLGDRPGVVVTGAVPDTRPWLDAADLVVAPLEVGRGVQNKVLEAMAMGKAVVASPAAFEGVEAEAGRDLMVAERAAFATAVADLLDDTERRAAIGTAARSLIVARYRWSERLAPLAGLLDAHALAEMPATLAAVA